MRPTRTRSRVLSLALAALRAAHTRTSELRRMTPYDSEHEHELLWLLERLAALDRELARCGR